MCIRDSSTLVEKNELALKELSSVKLDFSGLFFVTACRIGIIDVLAISSDSCRQVSWKAIVGIRMSCCSGHKLED